MDYYCDASKKTKKIKSRTIIFQILSQNELVECVPKRHTIPEPDFFDIDESFNNYITNHIKKIDVYLVKCDFKIVFGKELYPHIKSHLIQYWKIVTIFRLISFFLFLTFKILFETF